MMPLPRCLPSSPFICLPSWSPFWAAVGCRCCLVSLHMAVGQNPVPPVNVLFRRSGTVHVPEVCSGGLEQALERDQILYIEEIYYKDFNRNLDKHTRPIDMLLPMRMHTYRHEQNTRLRGKKETMACLRSKDTMLQAYEHVQQAALVFWLR